MKVLLKEVNSKWFIVFLFFKKLFLKGELCALSLDTRIDCDDCVAITPCGKLQLSVNKETYQCLGLDGKLSFFSRKHQDRYRKFIFILNFLVVRIWWFYCIFCSILTSVYLICCCWGERLEYPSLPLSQSAQIPIPTARQLVEFSKQ